MNIKRLAVTNYRCYERAELEPCAGITVLAGGNAQGKTALLEAMYLCCTGRSHRTPRDRELIKWGEDVARVETEVSQRDGTHDIAIAIPETGRKQVKVNGAHVNRSGELMGHLCGVLFSPEDLRMVKDGPAERRRFIDMELSQIRPAYYYLLQRYNRALTQRGRLLRDAQVSPALISTLPDWDEQLAKLGAAIIEYRRAFAVKLSDYASRIHEQVSGGQEVLRVSYASAQPDASGEALVESLRRAFDQARPLDIKRGVSSVGPHRDDLLLTLNGVDARAFGSQGQQRSSALSLKLSEIEVMRSELNESPVLMLDDVMSELDPSRRRALLSALGGVQTIVTCTDPDDLAGAEVGMTVTVDHGTLA